MKKILYLSLLTMLIPFSASAKLRVVTTINDLAVIARAVGRNRVEVESIAKPEQDPHFLQAKPGFILKASRADLFVKVGLDLEIGWAPALIRGSRNSKIQPGSEGSLDASAGIPVLEKPSGRVDRSQGDVHPYGNPHYWLDPERAVRIAKTIAERLQQLDPAGSEFYKTNSDSFAKMIAKKMKTWQKKLAPWHGTKLYSYHTSWSYLLDRFGMKAVEYIEPKPGIPPTPGHLVQLILKGKKEQIKAVFMADFYNPKSAKLVAKKLGIPLVTMPLSTGRNETYPEFMDHIIEKIAKALGGDK